MPCCFFFHLLVTIFAAIEEAEGEVFRKRRQECGEEAEIVRGVFKANRENS